MPLMPPDKKIGRFIVPGWLPSWMYTYIEMGADLELMKIELVDLRAEMAVLRKKLAAAEKAMRDDANARPDTVAYWRTKAEDWERWWRTSAQVRTGRGVKK